MNLVSIYTLCDPWSGEVRYVGMTRRLKHRIGQYQAANGGHTPHLKNWLSSVERNPAVVVLEEVPVEGADDVERKWIAWLRSYGARLINCTDGGEARFTWPPEVKERLRQFRLAEVAAGTHNFLKPESRAKATASRKGRPQPWSAKTIRAANLARRGKPLSPARIAQMRLRRGFKHTPEAKQRMRAAQQLKWSDPTYVAKACAAIRAKNSVVDHTKAVQASAELRRGVPLTEEHRRKVSEAQKLTWTPERRAAASAKRKGKLQHPMTEEMKQKIRASLQAWYAANPDRLPGGRVVKTA